MKKLLLLAIFAVVLTPLPARADVVVTQFGWDRTGAEHLPCDGSVQWTLAPGTGVIDATVGINDADGVDDGHAWTMLRDWQTETFYITTTEPVAPTDEVLLAYTGEAATPPVLSLVDCAEAVVIPPVEPPPTTGGSAPPSPDTTTWDIGFTVTTIKRTNVVVRSRLSCSNGVETRIVKRRLQSHAPLTRHLPATLDDATECNIRVVAYDIKPHVRPHNWPAPVVETWVIAS